MKNDDFKKGLTGSDHAENVEATGTWVNVSPARGERHGVLSPGGFSSAEWRRSLTIAKDETLSISFDYNLWACSHGESGAGDDFIVSLGDDGSYFEEILRINFADPFGGGGTFQEWAIYENTWDFDTDMALTLSFKLDNLKAPTQYGVAFIDNMEAGALATGGGGSSPLATSIPASILLLGFGLIGSVGLRRYLL
jgi:hypothetical protein